MDGQGDYHLGLLIHILSHLPLKLVIALGQLVLHLLLRPVHNHFLSLAGGEAGHAFQLLKLLIF